MISKELLKSEIDKVKTEYFGLLYRIIKAFEAILASKVIPSSM